MRSLILIAAALSLCSCANALQTQPLQDLPTQLPNSYIVDDQTGIAVETAYQAADLAMISATRAGLVNPAEATKLNLVRGQAYLAVCITRTAYDLANGKDPFARHDRCPGETKTGTIPSYVEAGRSAVAVVGSLVATLRAFSAGK